MAANGVGGSLPRGTHEWVGSVLPELAEGIHVPTGEHQIVRRVAADVVEFAASSADRVVGLVQNVGLPTVGRLPGAFDQARLVAGFEVRWTGLLVAVPLFRDHLGTDFFGAVPPAADAASTAEKGDGEEFDNVFQVDLQECEGRRK